MLVQENGSSGVGQTVSSSWEPKPFRPSSCCDVQFVGEGPVPFSLSLNKPSLAVCSVSTLSVPGAVLGTDDTRTKKVPMEGFPGRKTVRPIREGAPGKQQPDWELRGTQIMRAWGPGDGKPGRGCSMTPGPGVRELSVSGLERSALFFPKFLCSHFV